MGYYTRFELNTLQEFDQGGDFSKELEDISGYSLEEECKWYRHEKDMITLSKRHPYIVFQLNGEGEESGDLWVKYFKGGKMHECRAVVTYGEYNEKLLR